MFETQKPHYFTALNDVFQLQYCTLVMEQSIFWPAFSVTLCCEGCSDLRLFTYENNGLVFFFCFTFIYFFYYCLLPLVLAMPLYACFPSVLVIIHSRLYFTVFRMFFDMLNMHEMSASQSCFGRTSAPPTGSTGALSLSDGNYKDINCFFCLSGHQKYLARY